jgi:hypothetical protein
VTGEPTNTKIENIDALVENLDRMIALTEKKIETMRELKRAFELARLVPEVMKSKVRTHVVPSNSPTAPWRGATLFVNLGEGQVRSFDLVKDNVPYSLWPNDVYDSYQRHVRSQAKLHPRRVSKEMCPRCGRLTGRPGVPSGCCDAKPITHGGNP